MLFKKYNLNDVNSEIFRRLRSRRTPDKRLHWPWYYFRSINGEQEEFDADIPIKDEQLFNNNDDDDQGDEEEKTNEEDQGFWLWSLRWQQWVINLSILEKENLRHISLQTLKNFQNI